MNITRIAALLSSGITAAVLSGCAGQDYSARASQLALAAGMQRSDLIAPPFTLTSWSRIRDPHQPLHVYIEGDGFAWVTASQPARDPTPHNPLGLKLAAADPAANVAYIARPCQYRPLANEPACRVSEWTDRRYAPEVINAMNSATAQLAQRVPGQPLALVGYSGGGAVAALLAARRTDVATLRTVAGNLDQALVNQLHQATPMPASLNAIDVALRLATLPQIHFSGSADRVVPTSVTEHYQQVSHSACVQVVSVPGLTHGGDWAGQWPALLKQQPVCR